MHIKRLSLSWLKEGRNFHNYTFFVQILFPPLIKKHPPGDYELDDENSILLLKNLIHISKILLKLIKQRYKHTNKL